MTEPSTSTLTAEEKMNMGLDDIIRIERPKGYIHKIRNNFHKRKPRIPWRFNRSQQWRLGRNGPNSYRPRPFLSDRLRRKLQGPLPDTSVFHRLGWHTNWGAAKHRVRCARNQGNFGYKTFFNTWRTNRYLYNRRENDDKARVIKLFNSLKQYRKDDGLELSGQVKANMNRKRRSYNQNLVVGNIFAKSAPNINQQNLEKLSRALNGDIQSVHAEQSPAGYLVTQIVSRSTPVVPASCMEQNSTYNESLNYQEYNTQAFNTQAFNMQPFNTTYNNQAFRALRSYTQGYNTPAFNVQPEEDNTSPLLRDNTLGPRGIPNAQITNETTAYSIHDRFDALRST